MRSRSLRALFVLCALLCGSAQALADTHNVSYSTWTIAPQMITLRFVLPVAQAERLSGVQMPLLTVQKLSEYLLQHVSVEASGTPCPAIDQGWDLGKVDPVAAGPGRYGFEIFFRCGPDAGKKELVLKNTALFDTVSGHVNFARVETPSGVFQQLFTARQTELRVPETGPVRAAGFGSYLSLGFAHLLHSLDRLCVLLGALLLLHRRSDIAHLVLGLAAGYALCIVVSTAGWVVPRMPLIDAFIGLLVALMAAEILARQGARFRVAAVAAGALLLLAVFVALVHRSAPALMLGGAAVAAGSFLVGSPESSERAAWRVPALVTLLGFLDGFVLPADLEPMSLPGRIIAPMLIGFDVGAWLCAVLVLLALTGTLVLLGRKRLVLPASLTSDLAATALGGLGVFWLVSRLNG